MISKIIGFAMMLPMILIFLYELFRNAKTSKPNSMIFIFAVVMGVYVLFGYGFHLLFWS